MYRMIRGAVAVLLAAVMALAVVGCSSGDKVKVGETNAGESVNLAVGQQMEIVLASNPTTGYAWQVEDDAGGIVELARDPEFIQDPGPAVTGRGGAERLTFRATKSGSGTLVLEYRRPWEKGASAEKAFEIPVVVK